MDKNEWIEDATKLLKAIKFNHEHPSHQRAIIGGHEIELIDKLLKEIE